MNSNAHCNNLKRIQGINIRKVFEAVETKFEPFKRDSKHLNENSNGLKGIRSFQNRIRTIRKGFEAFETKFEQFERDSKLLKPKCEQFERDSKVSKLNSNHSKRIRGI